MEYHPDRNQNREKEIIPIFKPQGRRVKARQGSDFLSSFGLAATTLKAFEVSASAAQRAGASG